MGLGKDREYCRIGLKMIQKRLEEAVQEIKRGSQQSSAGDERTQRMILKKAIKGTK